MSYAPEVLFSCLETPFDVSHSDGHLKLQLEYFADKVENNLQSQLIAELMAGYASISAQMEESNRRLAMSDASRLEAQKIALLGNWNADLETQALTWSETMYTILEIAPDVKPDLQLFLSRIHPDDHAFVAKRAQELMKGLVYPEIPYRMQMPDGRIKWVSARHVCVQDNDGKPVSVHGTLQDVTTVKHAEELLKKYNDHLEELVQKKVQELFESQMSTIYALVKLAESRDDETGAHVERTSKYCRELATLARDGSPYASQIDEQFIQNMALASPLHDIGKVGIPDRILLKPDKLTPEEFETMKTHVIIGYQTLASIEKMNPGNAFLQVGMDITRYHHEKWNGGGYQQGLSGTDIPLAARIMALSDVYDALRSRRVYKEPFTHEASMRLMLEGRGTHFDPVLMDLFAAHHEAFKQIFDLATTDAQGV